MKCAPWTPETEKINIWGVWNGFLGLLASGRQKWPFSGIRQ